MVKSIEIFETKIPLDKSIMFLQPPLEELDTLPSHLQSLAWEESFPAIFRENAQFSQTISELLSPNHPFHNSFQEPLSSHWDYVIQVSSEIELTLKKLETLDKLADIIAQKRKISNEIRDLENAHLFLQKKQVDTIFQTKKALLQKKIEEREQLEPKFEIEQDEYNSLKNQLDLYIAQENQFKSQQKHLKDRQRDLYQATNEITKLMDELDPKIQLYKEKIRDLDPDDDKNDFERLQQKLESVQEKYNQYNQERKSLMHQSQTLKKNLLKERQNFKDIKKHLNRLRPSFDSKKEIFEKSFQRLGSLKQDIENLKIELDSRIFEETTKNTSNNGPTEINFSSIPEVEETLERKKGQLIQIDTLLNRKFQSTDIDQIQAIWDEKYSLLLKKSTLLTGKLDPSEKIANVTYASQIEMLKIIRFKDWMTYFLSSFEIEFVFDLQVHPEDSSLKTVFLLQSNKGDNLDFEENLTRIQKAYVAFSTIISLYLAFDIHLIPLQMTKLPSLIVTKQTFQKSIEMLADQIANHPDLNDTRLIFFMDNQTPYDLSIMKINP